MKVKLKKIIVASSLVIFMLCPHLLWARALDDEQALDEHQALDDEQAYARAYEFIRLKQYVNAKTALHDFIWNYQISMYLPQVHFWLAELALLDWNNDKTNLIAKAEAIKHYNFVYDNFNQHDKAADSLLKLGDLYLEDAKFAQAQALFSKIIEEYPNTTSATMAQLRLQAPSLKVSRD